MKRIWNIFQAIYSLDNLKLAHKNARKDKSLYKDVKMVNSNPDYYLWQIQDMLKNKTYKITKNDYSRQTVIEWHKERELRKLKYYPHRIIQWAIMLQIEDMLNKNMCYHTCASLKWRWWKRIHELMNKYLKDKEWTKYCLKIDIKKFYNNINHKILKSLLRKKIKDKDLLRLLDMIIDSFPWKKWIPIGSYLSQYLANFYLSEFDHRLKEQLHIKYVIRYMDDIVILSSKKTTLRIILRRIKKYLSWKLALQVKNNRQIFPTHIRWVDYIWYRYFWNYILLRKITANKLKRIIHNINNHWWPTSFKRRCSVNSYAWWLLYCSDRILSKKYIKPLIPLMSKYYSDNINSKESKVNKYTNKLKNKI